LANFRSVLLASVEDGEAVLSEVTALLRQGETTVFAVTIEGSRWSAGMVPGRLTGMTLRSTLPMLLSFLLSVACSTSPHRPMENVAPEAREGSDPRSPLCAALLSKETNPLDRFAGAISLYQGGGLWIAKGGPGDAAGWLGRIEAAGLLDSVAESCPGNRVVLFVPGLRASDRDRFVAQIVPSLAVPGALEHEYFISPLEGSDWLAKHPSRP
jgi:hypothetical protein